MEPRNRSTLLITSFLLFVAITSWFLLPSIQVAESSPYTTHTEVSFRSPKTNIWAELSSAEADDIYAFVNAQKPHLNLVKRPKSAAENSIFSVETLRPNKTRAVSYLFDDDGDIPERWAKVVLAENIDDEPYLVYYMVGPLPITNASRISPLTFPFNSGRNTVKSPIRDWFALIGFGEKLGEQISDITKKLLGATTQPDDPEQLICFPRTTRVGNEGLTLWFQFFRQGQSSNAMTLLPQGVYVKVNASSPDQEEWKATQFFYNGIVYKSVDEFRKALKSPDFKSTPVNLDGSWTDTEDFDAAPPGRELPPPVSIQPYGPRYKLDRKQKYISWFGFEFYVTTVPATGVALYDIRFKGERIMHQLGLEEAMAHYAGDDPMAGGQEFLDCFFGMGKSMFELVPGYDCPAYADYLDSHFHMAGEVNHQPNSICLFEYTSDHLLSRHSAQHSVTASRNTYLVLRSVSTVGNYDYSIDYLFYLDGTIEIKVRASGYIFAAFYRANKTEGEDEYGSRIGNAVASSVHDHVINFKADLDIAGPQNNLVRLALEPTTKKYDWDLPEYKERNTMHLVEYPVDEETGLDWPRNSGEFYIAYSADKKNSFGERKGYRITSGTGLGATPHLTILNSTTLGDSARWAEHDLWVLRQHDTEPRAADPLNYLQATDPIINFAKMVDRESLKQEDYNGDLVIYFNVGAHHIPHSGDLPNTLMHTSATSVMFIPHNFHDRDPSRESVQGVRLQLKGDKSGGFAGFPDIGDGDATASDLRNRGEKKDKARALYFGATYEEGVKLPLEAIEPNLLSEYESRELHVSNLGFNGSAAGVWMVD